MTCVDGRNKSYLIYNFVMDGFDEDDLCEALEEEGSIEFSGNRSVIDCPEKEDKVVCVLFTMPDSSGEQMPVCSGPIISCDGSDVEEEGVVEGCGYNPERLE